MFQRRNIIFNNMVVGLILLVPLPGFCQKYNELSWSIVSSNLYTSRITLKRGSKAIISYDLNCDISEALADYPDAIPDYERNQIDIIKTHLHPNGLLAVTCRVGAHSKQIAVYDPNMNSALPKVVKTGSYFTRWWVENGELWLAYDERCYGDNCKEPFSTLKMKWDSLND